MALEGERVERAQPHRPGRVILGERRIAAVGVNAPPNKARWRRSRSRASDAKASARQIVNLYAAGDITLQLLPLRAIGATLAESGDSRPV